MKSEENLAEWNSRNAGVPTDCSPVPKVPLGRNRLDDYEFSLSWDDLIESKARVGQ
jgi:hypothetical protein